MSAVEIDRIHSAFGDTAGLLAERSEISLLTVMDDVARKTILISAASNFEVQLSNAVQEYSTECAGKNTLLPSLIISKAIKRQYHTWFNWDSNNASTFFSLFGNDFKAHMKALLNAEPDLEQKISAFIELGRERNRLVHGDYATYTVEKTAAEIYQLYLLALDFVERVPAELRACTNRLTRDQAEVRQTS